MSVDPGTHSTGYCIMNLDLKLKSHGLLKARKKTWRENCDLILTQLIDVSSRFKPDVLILEYPEYWAGSCGFAARESGSLLKLSFLCGCIYAYFNTVFPVNIYLVTPSQWKGQLSKEVTNRRLSKIYPNDVNSSLDHNTVDAIGIAYFSIEKKIIYVK